MAITINYGPSAAALGRVAFDSGRGIEKRRRQESDREYGLRAQSQAFAMQQAALQEKARRRQEERLQQQQQIQLQQQLFDQARQRAEFNRALQSDAFSRQAAIADYNRSLRNDAFGQQRDRAIFNRSLVNDAFDQSYKRAMFGQNQQRYADLREQELYSRKEPYLQNTNKVLLQQIEQIREQYDGARWKNNQARDEYLKTMSELPALLAQEVPLETANKSLADFIGNFEQKGFRNKLAPKLTEVQKAQQAMPPYVVDGKVLGAYKQGPDGNYNGIVFHPSQGSASSSYSKRPYPQSMLDAEIEALQRRDAVNGIFGKLPSEYIIQATENLDSKYGVPASQQPGDMMSAAGQGEGERVGVGTVLQPGLNENPAQQPRRMQEQQAKAIEAVNEKQRRAAEEAKAIVDLKMGANDFNSLNQTVGGNLLARLDVLGGRTPENVAKLQKAVQNNRKPADPNLNTYSRKEIREMIQDAGLTGNRDILGISSKQSQGVPQVWNDKETGTVQVIQDHLTDEQKKIYNRSLQIDTNVKRKARYDAITASPPEQMSLAGDVSKLVDNKGFDAGGVIPSSFFGLFPQPKGTDRNWYYTENKLDKERASQLLQAVKDGDVTSRDAEQILKDSYAQRLITKEQQIELAEEFNKKEKEFNKKEKEFNKKEKASKDLADKVARYEAALKRKQEILAVFKLAKKTGEDEIGRPLTKEGLAELDPLIEQLESQMQQIQEFLKQNSPSE